MSAWLQIEMEQFTRQGSKMANFDCVESAISRNRGNFYEKIIFEHARSILSKLLDQNMIVRKDKSTVWVVPLAFPLAEKSWTSNKAVSLKRWSQLTNIFQIRLTMSTMSHLSWFVSLASFLSLDEDIYTFVQRFSNNEKSISKMGRSPFTRNSKWPIRNFNFRKPRQWNFRRQD